MAIQYGPEYTHPFKSYKNCKGRIKVQAQWNDGGWVGHESPMPNLMWCENRCASHLTGINDTA
ncbi:hypothetical protein [Mycobacterium sp.]|uniref:hypothetical protein n=1 Tax=Mycobacterium sp. TaxID=1785 RepID=UPI003F9C8B64